MIRISAYHIADHISVKRFKNLHDSGLLHSTNFELFYKTHNDSYTYIFNHGVIVFADMPDSEIPAFIESLKNFSTNFLPQYFKDEFIIYKSEELNFTYNAAYLPEITTDVIRLVMHSTGQSVSLDYYSDSAEKLLTETSRFTSQLERFGKLKISKKNLLKFIGKVLNIKNRIIENLYIFDVPEMVWENEFLDRVNNGMVKFFDINARFREIEYTLKVVESNLKMFSSLVQNKTANMLELIIILLILIEVIHVFVNYFI